MWLQSDEGSALVVAISRSFDGLWASSLSTSDEDGDGTFGWQLVHDERRNLAFYLHSYTGEVRWLPPRVVGFAMHGLHPIPASHDEDRGERQDEEGEEWSPYFPHVVMAPSGLLPVHEPLESAPPGGPYNRFPLLGLGLNNGGQRLLPPTWEDFGDAPPFLPPYPAVVLPSGSNSDAWQEVENAATMQSSVVQDDVWRPLASDQLPVLSVGTAFRLAPVPASSPQEHHHHEVTDPALFQTRGMLSARP